MGNKYPYEGFSQEHCEKWCKENGFPINFFIMSIDQRREEVYENWKRWSEEKKL